MVFDANFRRRRRLFVVQISQSRFRIKRRDYGTV
jgi:hypothetical protein